MCDAYCVVVPAVLVFGGFAVQDARLGVRYGADVGECARDEGWCFPQAVQVVVDVGAGFIPNVI